VRNLEQMRSFFLVYAKAQTVSAEFQLSWSHYLKLIRIDNEHQCQFYEIESIESRAYRRWGILRPTGRLLSQF